MKVAQIKKSWIVYPPNYKPGDGYFKVPFLKDAWNKACSLGVGSEVWLIKDTKRTDGSSSHDSGDVVYVVEQN